MSYSASPSLSSPPFVPPTPISVSTSFQSNGDVAFNDSQSATPAPESSTPAVASTSALEPDGEGGEQDVDVLGSGKGALGGFAADLETVRTRIKMRSLIKSRTVEEEEAMAETAARVASSLAADHLAVTYPDVDTPFTDAADALKRLLPYHVFQQPKEDLNAQINSYTPVASRKGKRKATNEDLLREEIAETKFALECWRRRKALQDRFRRTRIRSGKHASPDDQTCLLAQAVLETERTETASLNAELRSARAELDKVEREKRAAAPPQAPRLAPNYYASHPANPTSNYASQFRGYTYPYAQPYGASQYTYNPAHPYGTTSYAPPAAGVAAYANGTAFVPTATASTYVPPATTPAAAPASTASAPAQPAQRQPAAVPPMKAIPVQLPAASLPALLAIGIKPVPAASVPPADQPQPAAVLKGQSGTTLSLEINIASLQSSQMSGLALILNALTSKGVNVDGSAGAGAGAGTGVAAAGGSGAGAAVASTSGAQHTA
ncbi:hypothetical protein B0H21DRAFT_732989 [Amylocystis lapponica]|nr:hypothetical protein B0H21DRAFT_732989 [Amylocystis lapponica]